MKHALTVLMIVFVATPSFAGLYDNVRLNALYKKEATGIRAYGNGDYHFAFRHLSDTATKGLKESQYLVSIMLMRGQGTYPDYAIELALTR